jgi:hypothetical protein
MATASVHDAEHRHGGTGGHAGHDAQDHQTEDIVDHGRADDDARFGRGHPAKVGKHPRGDPDGRGGQRGADEDRGGGAVAQAGGGMGSVRPVGVAEPERHQYPDHGHREGRRPTRTFPHGPARSEQ